MTQVPEPIMAIPRRFLPSMSLLYAFEAAARSESFTAAAAELNLTQSAVSRQVRALEDMLGCALFLRERQTVKLTAAGDAYAAEIREALRRIGTATLGLRANPAGGSLSLAILPTFGTRWLAPRLPGFLNDNPGITVNLTTRLAPFDFQFDQVDAAIHFGQADWSGAEMELLMGEMVVPACSAGLRERLGIRTSQDLVNAPLLHLVLRPDAWERWFAAMDMTVGHVSGMLIDQFATAAQSAAAGMGVALLPKFLIEAELSRGDLVEAVNDGAVPSAGHYYLAWPAKRTAHPPLLAFRTWLKKQLAAEAV